MRSARLPAWPLLAHAPDLDRLADEIEAAARVFNKAMARTAEANFVVKLNVYRQDLQDDVQVRVGTALAAEVTVRRR